MKEESIIAVVHCFDVQIQGVEQYSLCQKEGTGKRVILPPP
jgi:hypothetical protein